MIKTPVPELSEPPRGYRVADVSRATRIPKSSLYRLIKTKKLSAVRYSDEGLVIMEADLLSFIARNRTGSAE